MTAIDRTWVTSVLVGQDSKCLQMGRVSLFGRGIGSPSGLPPLPWLTPGCFTHWCYVLGSLGTWICSSCFVAQLFIFCCALWNMLQTVLFEVRGALNPREYHSSCGPETPSHVFERKIELEWKFKKIFSYVFCNLIFIVVLWGKRVWIYGFLGSLRTLLLLERI